MQIIVLCGFMATLGCIRREEDEEEIENIDIANVVSDTSNYCTKNKHYAILFEVSNCLLFHGQQRHKEFFNSSLYSFLQNVVAWPLPWDDENSIQQDNFLL